MKIIATILPLFGIVSGFSQGALEFQNTATTLISANGVPMPARTSIDTTFYFAIFLAPSTTVTVPGITAELSDPNFQIVDPGAYTTNSPFGAGRLTHRTLSIGASQGYFPGSTVDFIVRGWSANAGPTWAEALETWNDGEPLVPMFIGSSTVGNDLMLSGGAQPYPVVFGIYDFQVTGFNMIFVPEPSAMALAVLGGVSLLARTRRRA